MRREQIIEFLNFDDLVNRHPKDEPYVVLIGYESFQPTEYEEVALYSHSVHFNSLMISTDSKERALNEIDYHLVFASEGGYFEQAPSGEMIYNLNESWDYVDGLTVEPLILDRHWPGLGIQFYEPTQRMILYLGALNKNGDWINPYTEDVIIRSMQKNELLNEVRHSINRIEIKVDYLKDYLAARKSGLLIAKYSSRVLMFQSTDQIPILDSSKEVPHGRWNYHYVNEDSKSPKELWAEAELRQKFWIDPLPEPRHEGAHPRGEFVGGVKFTLQDGTKEEYDVEAGHRRDYFKLISFNPRVMEIFLNRLNYDYREYTKETMVLIFPTGEELDVAINPSGQIQVLWGQVAKLSKTYQELIAPFSEPWQEKISRGHDYWRTSIEAEFPRTKPLKKTLQDLKSEINDYFSNRFHETFFNDDSKEEDLKRVYEPYEKDPHLLLEIMELLDKWLMSEKRPKAIIEFYNLVDLMENKDEVENIKSLVSLELLLKKYFGEDFAKEKTEVLRLIKDLRICKAHYKDLSKVLEKYDLKHISSREIYKSTINNLENFLVWLAQQCADDIFQ